MAARKEKWVGENGLGGEYAEYVRNSQRLQQLGRKYPDRAGAAAAGGDGLSLLADRRLPGGTGEGDSWEEGWFDYFWQPKGITPREGQAINAAVLPLIGAGVDDRTLWNDAARSVDVVISNYGEQRSARRAAVVEAAGRGQTVASGTTQSERADGRGVDRVAGWSLTASASDAARKLELVVDVNGAHANSWSFWSFPRGPARSRRHGGAFDREMGGHQPPLSIRSTESALSQAPTAC